MQKVNVRESNGKGRKGNSNRNAILNKMRSRILITFTLVAFVTTLTAGIIQFAKGPEIGGSFGSTVLVTAPTMNVFQSVDFDAPITVSDITGLAVRSYQFDIFFDPSIIVLQDPAVDTTGTISNGRVPFYNEVTPGHLFVTVFSATDLTGAGTLLNLKFSSIGSIGNTSPVTFGAFQFNEQVPNDQTVNGAITIVGPTPTNTPTATPTNTPTATPTNTPTATPTNTPTATPTNTPTATPTNTPTATPTNTPTATPTNTPTATPTSTPANTTVQFSSATYIEDESQTASIMVTRVGDLSGSTTVNFQTSPGTAIQGASCGGGVDYVGVASQSITFNPTESQKFVNVEICGDSLFEMNETVILALTGASIGAPGIAVLTINDTATRFRNANAIEINSGGSSNPYPSQITVTGGPTIIGSMRVTLYDLGTVQPDNVDVLLVGPGGQRFVLMGNSGGSNNLGGPVTLNFTDTAGQVLPDSSVLTTGNYEPTTWGAIQAFPAPAPGTPYNLPGSTIGGTGTQTLVGNFGSTNSNGIWSLYVREDTAPFSFGTVVGNFAGGWGLEFLATTASGVTLSGRTLTPESLGLRNAKVTVTDSQGMVRTAVTGSFGMFRFDDLTAGETYVVSIESKRFTFEPRVVQMLDNIDDMVFIALE